MVYHLPAPACSSSCEGNMLTATRGPNDFVGISAMVDPGQRNKVGGDAVPACPGLACCLPVMG